MDLISAGQFATWAWNTFGSDAKESFLSFLRTKWKQTTEEHIKLRYLEANWKGYNWDKAAEKYKKNMQVLYGLIRIIGTNEPIEISDIFTDVYVLDKPLAFRRFDIALLHQLQAEPENLNDTERIRGLSVVVQERGHRLYILGKPGAGKTTFLKYLVHQTIENSELNKIPIFITLKDWTSSGLGLTDFIVKQFDICHFPNATTFIEYLLESGKAIVLFDGLDEVPQEHDNRNKITTELHNFSKKNLRTQVIITCRIAASDYSFSEFTYIEMADFNDNQVRNYVFNWFAKDLKKSEMFLNELDKDENKSIRDLGRSPLLLSMICLAYNETLTIPQRRVELYEDALDALLKKWDASRNIRRDEIYKDLSIRRKKQMFARIAAQHFEKSEIFFAKKNLTDEIEDYLNKIPKSDSKDSPDGDAVLEAIEAQHGVFSQRAQGVYAFAHLTFQEYYTAKYIVDNSRYDSLMSHISDSRWREVFLLVSSLLNEADDFFLAMQKEASKIIRADSVLFQIHRHIESKTTQIKEYLPSAVRALYYFLNLDIYRVVDQAVTYPQAFNYVSRAINLVASLDNHIVIDHAISSEFVLDPKIAQTFNTDYPHRFENRDAELYLAIENRLSIVQRLTRIQNRLHKSGQGVYDVFVDLNLASLLQITKYFVLVGTSFDLSPLLPKLNKYFDDAKVFVTAPEIQEFLSNTPEKNSTPIIWHAYFEGLHAAIQKYSNLRHHVSLSIVKLQAIDDFIKANQLILDCLEVAYVEDRNKIVNNVLSLS